MKTHLPIAVVLSGVGLHLGQDTQVKIIAANPGEGRYFVRTDLPDQPPIPALVNFVDQTTLSTELRAGKATIRTVEHLLAALVSCGVADARIEVNGSEIPLLDGSALPWVTAIAQAGLGQIQPNAIAILAEPIWIREGDAFVAALPASEIRFTYGIDFPYPAIGNQWQSWSPNVEDFAQAIAPARTFGFADQIDYLRKKGLIKGGSLENALVCDQKGWINPPLRFANEPVRHKLLDLVGDLSLLGVIPQAHFLAYKASHHLHIKLAQAVQGQLTRP
jgi:UDP-3-O-[3-hydroxymyristoyl] N-acetylglucosamine deacetylase